MRVSIVNRILNSHRSYDFYDFLGRKGFTLCALCGQPTFGAYMHKVCVKYDKDQEAESAAWQDMEDREIYEWNKAQQHLDDLMASFCIVSECFEEGDRYSGLCTSHDGYCHYCLDTPCSCEDDQPDDQDDPRDQDDYEDDSVSYPDVYRRALSHTHNPELAHEAASIYPGDYM